MSDTPKTDALREVVIGQYKEDELTGDGMGNILSALTDIETLERERECECKCDVDWPEEYYELRQRLERERDEARERADTMFVKHAEILDQYRRERDSERALADRLAEAFKDLWDNHTMYGAGYEVVEKALAAWKEARND